MTTEGKRFTIYHQPNFDASIEYNNDFVLFHFERVNKISHNDVKNIRAYLKNLREFMIDMGYENIHASIPFDNKVACKLASTIGFIYQDNILVDSVYYDVFKLGD